MEEYGLVQRDKLKDIMREILDIEEARSGVKEDMVRVKEELNVLLPRDMVSKCIKVYMYKGLTESDANQYQEICDLLGIPFVCTTYIPTEMTNPNPEQAEAKKKILEFLKSYKALADERNEYSCQIRNNYAKAKNIGVSVPILKKVIDFCLHPDKLSAYQESCPLLESYVDVSKEI